MAELPFMPVEVQAAIADTRGLDIDAKGLYWDLMFYMWANGGWLDDDEKKLRKLVGLTPMKFRKIFEEIEQLFLRKDGKITQKRIQKEWEKIQKKRKKPEENEQNFQPNPLENNGSHPPTGTPESPLPPPPIRTGNETHNETSTASTERVSEIFKWLEDHFNQQGQINRPLITAPVSAWLSWGADFELDIKPTAERWSKKNPGRQIGSLEWLHEDIARSMKQRQQPLPQVVQANGSVSSSASNPISNDKTQLLDEVFDERSEPGPSAKGTSHPANHTRTDDGHLSGTPTCSGQARGIKTLADAIPESFKRV